TYYFEGFKVTHPDFVFQVWPATTTLYITIYDGESAASPLLGKGMLQIVPEDFVRQLGTMKVTNAPNLASRLADQTRFARFFLGPLFEPYADVFALPSVF